MKNIVIFDMDGTILNSLGDLTAALNYVLALHGYPSRNTHQACDALGKGVAHFLRYNMPQPVDEKILEQCVKEFKQYYPDNMYKTTAPYGGILNLLANLKARGCKLGVISNKFDAAVKGLCDRYFKGIFDVAVGERAGIKRKPAPDSVYKVLEQLGADKKQAVYVGDSEVDYQTALNAGLPCISVTWGFRNKEFLKSVGANNFADTPQQVADMVELL